MSSFLYGAEAQVDMTMVPKSLALNCIFLTPIIVWTLTPNCLS